MKHTKNSGLKKKIFYILFAVFVTTVTILNAVSLRANEDDAPSHKKRQESNNDGTYQLSLDVTGETESKVGKANVIVIVDTSGSMSDRAGNETRLQAAKSAVKSLSKSLLGNNTEANKDIVQLALVTFSTTAKTAVEPTTKYEDVEGAIENLQADGGTNWEAALLEANNVDFGDNDPKYVIFVSDGDPTFRVSSHNGDRLYNNGRVRESDITNPDEYYYSVTDIYGRTYTQWWDNKTSNAGEGHRGTGSTDYYEWNYTDAAAIARTVVENGATLYSIGAYGDVNKMEDLAQYAYEDDEKGSEHYYNASSTTELQNALNTILEEIETSGIGEVSITDGTTSAVKAKSGTVHLLKVDQSSYKYWLSMEAKKDENGNYYNDSIGSKITFTKSGANYIGTWTDKKGTHTITGTIEEDPNDESKEIFKMQWTNEGNDLHNFAPPVATLNKDENDNESVEWDLKEVGTLLNGVTYTVTFDVWPTQYTYDLIADLNNEKVKYEDLSSSEDNTSPYAGLDKYISKTLTGEYFLKTNTEAVLNYKDTRKENPKEEQSKYINPPAVETKVEKISVEKKWENDLDSEEGNPIDIVLNRKTGNVKDEFYKASLTFANNYKKENINIATGLMRLKKSEDGQTGEVQILETGHDYTFEEVSEHYYKWELIAQTVHPMIINGELKELVLLDEAATQTYKNDELPAYSLPKDMPEGADYYDDGTNKYVKLDGKLYIITDAKPIIKAYNYRRSNLNITKTVDGKNADPDELFEFKITVKDPGLSSGEKLWFSVFDENNKPVIDESLPVSSNWTPERKDGNLTGFYYGENESELTVSLKAGQNLRFTNLTTKATYTIEESDKDNYTFKDAEGNAKYGKNQNPVDYIKGTDYKVDKNSKKITGDITLTNTTFSIEVTNTYELVSIDLTKVWDDASNQDGIRPDDIKVQVYRQVGENGEAEAYGDPITITKDSVDKTDSNKWIYTIESSEELALPRFDTNGEEYLYSVKELEVEKYETEYEPKTVNQTEGKATYTITNKHNPEKYNENGELEVTKHWDDFDNEDKLRKEVTVELYKNGEPTGKTITLKTDQDSKAKFTNLPMYESGKEISYTIVETTSLTGYEKPEYDMNTKGSFKVTNKHTPLYNEKGELEVTKHWDDVDNKDNLRKEVTVELYINGEKSGKTVTLTTDQDSKAKFTNLPKYDKDGKEIEYTIVETTTLEKYEEPKYDMSKAGSFTVTNKYTPLYNENGELEVTKHWDDFDNVDDLRKEVTVELYINGEKSGKTVTLTTDQDSKAKFTNLPKYDKDGKEIEYTIVETTSLEKYEEPKYDMNTKSSFTVTNKYTPLYNENGELEVTKHWDDVDNEDGLRKEVTVELYINGEKSGKTVTLKTNQDSKAKFTNLPRFDKDGKEIEYTIVETTTLEKYEKPEYDMNTKGSFTVTNKHVPLYNKDGKLKVTKYWEDNNDYDGLRKDVTVELYINNSPSGKTVNLTKVDGSNDLFTDLPKYDENGKEIEYTIVETTSLTGYEDPEYDMDTPGDFKVTNIHGVVPVSINVKKIWIDNDNQDGKRKDEITVKIFANGDFLKNETIKGDVEKDTWTYTIRGLDRYKDGSEITYTIEEVQVDEYEEPVVSGNAKEGFTIKNTHNPSKISKTGTKTWDHKDNQFDHPDSITVILHAKVGDEELETQSQTVTEKDGKWEYSFTGLDEYKDGKIITYWVDEAPVTDYTTVIDKDGNIKNTYSPEKFTINGTKSWDDENNQDGKRPDHITVILHGIVDGQEIKEVRQQKDVYEVNSKWEYSFENVYKYAGGKEIEYSIEELPVSEYDEPIIHGTADEGFSITNHHTPETITYIVKKNWDDYNNADEIRPDSINVTLYKTVNGVRTIKQTFTINAENDWTYTFTDLPRYEGGKEITYDIVEDVVEGYAASYDTNDDTVDDKIQINTTITNTQTVDITINKTWDDQDNHDGIRPEYIIVNIFANGDLIDSIRITKDDNWKKVVEGLLKYQNGVLITYTIEEETVDGYKTTIDGFNITNTHEVIPEEQIEVMPPKTGVDSDKTNYPLLISLALIGVYEVIFNKKTNIEVLSNLKSIRN